MLGFYGLKPSQEAETGSWGSLLGIGSCKNVLNIRFTSARVPTFFKSHQEHRAVAKLLYISETPFPSQKGSIFPDPAAQEKRLRTFLYHHLRNHIKRESGREGDDEEVES